MQGTRPLTYVAASKAFYLYDAGAASRSLTRPSTPLIDVFVCALSSNDVIVSFSIVCPHMFDLSLSFVLLVFLVHRSRSDC